MRRIWGTRGVGYRVRRLAIRQLMLGLAVTAAISSEAGAVADWSFETIAQIAVPAGCTAPEVRLTGLDYDLPSDNRPVVGWGEKNNCASGASLTQDLKWSRKSTGAWGGATLGGFPGVPELAVSPGGVPFYIYAAAGTGADSGNTYVWRADLNLSATGPGGYTGPADLLGATTSCAATPFIAADFTTGGTLPSWVRGATCAASPGPVRLDAAVDIAASKSIIALDHAIGPDGVSHVVFHDGSNLFYSPGTVGSATSILTTTRLRGVAIAVDAAKTIHLVTGDVDNGQMLYMAMTPPPVGSGIWTQEILDATGGQNPAIAIDPSGNPCVSYWRPAQPAQPPSQPAQPDQVRFGCRRGSAWGDIRQVTTSLAGSNNIFLKPTETRLVFDRAASPKPRILAYRPSSSSSNPSGFELLLLSNEDLAPVVGTIDDRTNNENTPILLNIAALSSDPDGSGETLSYGAVGLPSGLGIGATTGLITGTISFSAAQTGPVYNVTVSVSDGTLVASRSFKWTVVDVNRAPTISCPTPTPTLNEGTTISPAIQVVAADPDGNPLAYGLSVSPSASWLTISSGSGAIGGTPPFTAAGLYTLTLSVTDGIPPAVTIDCFWTVNNVNGTPSVSPIANQTSNEGHLVPGPSVPSPGVQVVASDPDLDSLTYKASGLPGGLSIGLNSGLITGTVSFSAAGTSAVDYVVRVDVCESARPLVCASTQFTWTVKPVNQPPTIALILNQTTDEGSSITPFQINATDGDPDTTLTLTAAGLPPGLSMDSAGRITGTPPFNTNASTPFTVTISANDGVITAQRSFQWTVNNKNAPPVVTNPGPQISTENASVSLQIVASDPDNPTATPTAGLTYAISGQPSPLTISATGLISGVAPLVGSFTVTVTASDATSTSPAAIFTWSVSNVNQQPAFTGDCPPAVNEGSSITLFSFTATDPDSDPLRWSATLLPPGLSIDTTTGEVTGAPTFTAAGNHSSAITISDGVTASVVKNCTWTVNNTNAPPTPVHPGNQSIVAGTELSLTISANDPDKTIPGDTLTFSLGPGSPPWVSITAGGVLSGSTNVAGTYTVTVIVTDLAGASNFVAFHVSVGSTNLPPVFGAVPATYSSAENSSDALLILASDPDNDPLTYTLSLLPAPVAAPTISIGGLIDWTPSYTDAGVYIVTVTVRDTAGLEVKRDIAWTVNQENRAPSFVGPPGAQSNAETDVVDLPITVTDLDITAPNHQNPNLIDTLTCKKIDAINLPPGLSINEQTCRITGTVSFDAFTGGPPYAVKVKVTDSAGAFAEHTFMWTINNTNRAPTLNRPPDQTNTEGAIINPLLLVANDADLPADTLTYSAMGLPPGISLNTATGRIESTGNLPLSFTSAGIYPVKVCVRDRNPIGSDGFEVCQNFSWTITDVNLKPTTLTGPANQSVCEGQVISLFLFGSDPDLGDLLTYESANSGTSTALGALGLSVNPTTGEISGTILYSAARPAAYVLTMLVRDKGNLTAQHLFSITVCNTNRPPVFSGPPAFLQPSAAVNADENTSFSIDIDATDPDSDPRTYTAPGLPSWLTISGGTGLITGIPPYTSAGVYLITVCVQDRNPLGSDGLKVCRDFTLTVANTDRQPDVANLENQANKEDDALSFPVIASDVDMADRGGTLTYSAINLPPGISINPVTGYIYGIVKLTASDTSPYSVVVFVSDGELTTTGNFTWTITPNRPCLEVTLCHRTIVPADGRKVPIRFRRISRSSRVVIDSITQDEETNRVGIGGTTIDAGGIGLSRGWVRAERDPDGNGRVYTVNFTLTDRLGRKYSCNLKVRVPVSSTSGRAIEDSTIYNSRPPLT